MSVSVPISTPLESGSEPAPRARIRISPAGIALLVFVLYLVNGPAARQSDVVASVLSYSLLVLGAIGLGAIVIFGRSVRRSIVPSITASEGRSSPSSPAAARGDSCLYVLRLGTIAVPPFFALRVRTFFEKEDPGIPVHTILGSASSERTIAQELRLPHRGDWKISHLLLSFGDRFGLASFTWRLDGDAVKRAFHVRPPLQLESGLPILSSAHRSGEMITEMTERRGDPFDLKAYHPSDGVKKIVWKIYARTGELVSRHPEASITPEGQVVVFVSADKSEDDVCSSALAYVSTLEALDLEIFVSCEGARDSQVARTSEETERLLIGTVWETPCTAAATRRTVEELVECFRDTMRESQLERVIVFCGERRISDEASLHRLIEIGAALEQRNASPVFFLTKNAPAGTGTRQSSSQGWRAALRSLFVGPDEREPSGDARLAGRFMSICAERQWQIII